MLDREGMEIDLAVWESGNEEGLHIIYGVATGLQGGAVLVFGTEVEILVTNRSSLPSIFRFFSPLPQLFIWNSPRLFVCLHANTHT